MSDDTNIHFIYTYTGLDGLQHKIDEVNRSSGALASTHSKLNTNLFGTASKLFILWGLYSVGSKVINEVTQYLGKAVDSYREFNEAITEVSTTLTQQEMYIFILN